MRVSMANFWLLYFFSSVWLMLQVSGAKKKIRLTRIYENFHFDFWCCLWRLSPNQMGSSSSFGNRMRIAKEDVEQMDCIAGDLHELIVGQTLAKSCASRLPFRRCIILLNTTSFHRRSDDLWKKCSTLPRSLQEITIHFTFKFIYTTAKAPIKSTEYYLTYAENSLVTFVYGN